MRLYELTIVAKSSLSDGDRKKLIDSIKDWLKGLKVVKEEDWGQKALAYPIKKEQSGHYHMLELETEGTVPVDFETRLIRHENILRHLLLRKK